MQLRYCDRFTIRWENMNTSIYTSFIMVSFCSSEKDGRCSRFRGRLCIPWKIMYERYNDPCMHRPGSSSTIMSDACTNNPSITPQFNTFTCNVGVTFRFVWRSFFFKKKMGALTYLSWFIRWWLLTRLNSSLVNFQPPSSNADIMITEHKKPKNHAG